MNILQKSTNTRKSSGETAPDLPPSEKAHCCDARALAQQSVNPLLRNIMDCVTESVAVVDTDLCFLGFNQTFEQRVLSATGKQIMVGMSLLDLLADQPEMQTAISNLWKRALAGESFTEVREFGKDDLSDRISEISYSCLRDDSGRVIGAVHISRDITARLQAEEAIKKSAAMLAEAQSVAQVGSWELDLVSGQGIWSAEMFRLLEFDPAEGIPAYERLLTRFHPDDVALHIAMEKQARETGEHREFDIRVCYSDGRQGWLHTAGRSVKDKEGKVVRTIGTVMDITARKEAEMARTDALQKAGEYQKLFDLAWDMVAIVGFDGYFKAINPAWPRTLGYSEKELLSHPYLFFVHPEDQAATRAEGTILVSGLPGTVGFENRYRCKDGSYRWLSWNAIADPARELFYSVAHDVTERKRTEAELQANDRRYHLLMSAMKDVVSLFDMDARCLYVSPSVYEQTGYTSEECLNRSGFDWIHPDDREMCVKQAYQHNLQGKDSYITWRLVRKDGTVILVETKTAICKDAQGRPEYMLCVTRDISDRKRLEDQFHQAQKMESIGQLAGGIAHDFNNLLSVILGYAEMIEDELPKDSRSRDKIGNIALAATRASSLTNQLLTFARRQPSEPQFIFLNELIQEMSNLLKPLIREEIHLHMQLDFETKQVRVDRHQLEQAIVNLVVNARDAMPEGGTLTIGTTEEILEQPRAHAYGVVPAGEYAVLSISDTGIGMTDEVKARLFEPFFTTKGVGKGTGLGLAMVYGIVKQSDGSILVESAVGKGTTFAIYLPCVDKEIMPAPEMQHTLTTWQGEETVLVVEDEPVLRDLAVLMLEKNGYVTLQAANGLEALRLAEAYPNTIHLLLTDAIMPEMGGKQLAERLRQKRPGIAVLVASGYSDDQHRDFETAFPDAFFLPKPYTPKGLLAKVQEILKARTQR